MSIYQFFRILWARRFIIVAAPLIALVCAVVAIIVLPPKYVAETRIMLDVIKPDPVTGQVMSSPFLRAYIKTQTELISDLRVASRAVESLGWVNNPKMLKDYQQRKSGDDRDFTRWAAQRIVDGTNVKLIEGSNIIEIGYASKDPEEAKQVADAVRVAYVATSLAERRDAARRNADWYDVQAQKAQAALTQAETEKAAYEKATGILLQDDRTDVDSARLAALASTAASTLSGMPIMTGSTPAGLALAQLDAQIAQAASVLGPNHPDLLDMRRRRELVAGQARQEQQAASAAASATGSAVRQSAGALEAQKSKVMAQRDKVERLRLLQDNVTIRREQYNKTATRAADLRQEAEIADTGVTTLGSALTPQDAVFPNKILLLGGGLLGGAGFGLALALLLEMLVRRVRSFEDIRSTIDAPVLAYIMDSRVKTARVDFARFSRNLTTRATST